MAWAVHFDQGVWLPQVGWWLDAHFPAERSFVSHAHFDHLALHREILCSEGTARLMRARLPGERIEHVLAFGRQEQLTADCSVTLHPAGHIFGSAQALLAHADHGTLLYTGDFKLRPGLSAEPCATPPADTLIIETTFGKPQYVFPPTRQVLDEIVRFCQDALAEGETPVLFAYSLGKSQEILRSLLSAQLPVMLHPQTFKYTRIYAEMGVVFPPYRLFDPDEAKGHVVICPLPVAGSSVLKKLAAHRTAVITGWALDPGAIYRYQCDAAFPLSDHADFPDLLRFVALVQPRRVLTLHGFATAFAQTLREQGMEAWAVGQANQLELGLPATKNKRPAVALDAAGQADTGARESAASGSFADFAAIAERVKAASRKTDKVALLAGFLTELSTAEAARAAVFFTGRAFSQAEDRTLNLGWSIVKRAVLEVAEANDADFRAAYRRFADAGDAAELMLLGKTEPGTNAISEVAAFFDLCAGTRGPVAKLELIANFLRRLKPAEAKYLIKIVSGDLRIGLKEGLLEEAIAVSSGQPLAAVREANLLCGDVAEVMNAAREGRLDRIQLRIFHPLQFMLASPEPTAGAIIERLGAPVWLEEKYDGIRCQLHKRGERIELYSRDLHRITGQFPDLALAARKLPGDFIGDGELLAWNGGRALPFAELQKRLGRKGDDFFLGEEIPVSILFFDLFWLDGRVLLKEPLRVRRELLAGLLAENTAGFALAPIRTAATELEVEAAFLASRGRGNEGLVAKDPNSAYTPGRRGLAWLKLKKAYATLDVVVVAVEYGHGKRRDVLSDYTFAIRDADNDRLLTVGKAYSGLTDAEIAQLTRHFLENTLEEKGGRRMVVPDVVLEIAFDSIRPSDRHESGFALRFPRINRIREDKKVTEIDTLDTCRKLAGAGS